MRVALAVVCFNVVFASQTLAGTRSVTAIHERVARNGPEVSPATGVPQMPERAPIVGSIELHLPKDADPTGLAALVTLRPGAPLSKRDARRTIERLWGTGRFSNLVVDATPGVDGRLAVVIEAATRTYVDRVEIEGNVALPEKSLRKTLALGDRRFEYYPEYVDRLVSRLKMAYGRIGYTRAQIDPVLLQGELGETVLSFRIQERKPTLIQGIHVAGDPQLGADEIVATLGMRPGDVLNLDVLDRGMSALKARYRAEKHYRARFGLPQVTEGPGGAVLRLPVTAGPKVEFRFQGNDAFDDEVLAHRLAYDPEQPLDEGLVTQLEERIARFYRIAGFSDVRVRSQEIRSADRRRSFLVFHIQEGPPLHVTSVTFEGNAHFGSSFLRERLLESLVEAAGEADLERARPDELFMGGRASGNAHFVYDPATVWYEPAYQEALARIVELYRADGYLNAAAQMPIVERDERRHEATIRVRIREGVQTFVSEIALHGAPDPVQLAKAIALTKGRPLNALEVETSRQAIQRALGHDGWVFAKVDDEKEIETADPTQAKVTFNVVAGPKVKVGRILVQGLSRTHESVVRGALAVEEGGILDPEAVAQSQRNLVRLGIFRTVSLRMNAPEVPEETKDLYVTVDEGATLSASASVGYSTQDGPRLLLEGSKINLLGRGLELQARAKLNYVYLNLDKLPHFWSLVGNDWIAGLGWRVNVTLQYPRILSLLPVEAGLHLSGLYEHVIRTAFTAERMAGIVGTNVTGPHGVSASAVFEIESDTINKNQTATTALPFDDLARLRFDEGTIDMMTPKLSVRFDGRDDPANPRKGVFLSATGEFVQSLGGLLRKPDRPPHSQFIKGSAEANVYIPLFKGGVLAFSIKAGKIFPLDRNSETIPPKRFFLGGASSMRGFSEDGMVAQDQRQKLAEQVRQCNALLNKTGCSSAAMVVAAGKTLLSEGGEMFTLGRAELRFPLRGPLGGALFFDTGNLWLDQTAFKATNLRYAAGFGVRLGTPIGPAAMDLGFNLDPDTTLNESVFTLTCNIGLF